MTKTQAFYKAGQLSAQEFYFEILAETAERRNERGEIELVYGKSAGEFRFKSALYGLQSLTLRQK